MGWTLRKRVIAVLSTAAVAGAMSLVVVAGPAAGQTTFTPSSATPDGDPGSLRDVLQNDVADGDIVVLDGGTYTLDDSGGDIDIDAAVTIQGNGATIRQTVAGARVLDLNVDDNDLTLQNVTITGGRVDGDGGGVRVNDSDATLTIEGSTLTDNATVGTAGTCSNDGGAIEADGALVIRTSTLSNNSACDDGGAFNHDSNDAETTVIASTLSGNCAEDNGGANDSDGNLTMVNSTVTGNTSDEQGAIDMDSADLTLVYSDVVQNTHDGGVDCPNTAPPAVASVPDPTEAEDAPEPDDVEAQQTSEPSNIAADGDFFVFGSVVALPVGDEPVPFNCDFDEEPTTTSSGFNFSDDDTCGFTNTAQGDRENAGDPGLAALASNGGPTQTRLPLPGSPLVNFIPIPDCGGGDDLAGFAVTTDQRGVSRPQETGCEIGSVEIEPPVPPGPAPAPTAVPVEPRFTG